MAKDILQDLQKSLETPAYEKLAKKFQTDAAAHASDATLAADKAAITAAVDKAFAETYKKEGVTFAALSPAEQENIIKLRKFIITDDTTPLHFAPGPEAPMPRPAPKPGQQAHSTATDTCVRYEAADLKPGQAFGSAPGHPCGPSPQKTQR